MAKKTREEITQAAKDALFRVWLREQGLTVDDWNRVYDATPVEYALAIQDMTEGEIQPSDWPHVLPVLKHGPERGILRHEMQDSAYQAVAKVPGRPPKSRHPFSVALKAKKVNLQQWARAHGEKRSRVQSWILDGEGGRPIPRKYADEIQKDLGVQATERVWKNGIQD